MPDAPLKYIYFIWRREMGVDYQTAMQTPFQVIMRDIEMMGLENKWGPNSLKPEDVTDNSGASPGIIRQVVGT